MRRNYKLKRVTTVLAFSVSIFVFSQEDDGFTDVILVNDARKNENLDEYAQRINDLREKKIVPSMEEEEPVQILEDPLVNNSSGKKKVEAAKSKMQRLGKFLQKNLLN